MFYILNLFLLEDYEFTNIKNNSLFLVSKNLSTQSKKKKKKKKKRIKEKGWENLKWNVPNKIIQIGHTKVNNTETLSMSIIWKLLTGYFFH